MDKYDLYLRGKPIKTEFGLVRFLTYEEYLECLKDLNVISLNALHLYYLYRNEMIKQKASKKELEDFKKFKKLKLYDIIRNESFKYLLDSYLKVFNLVLDVNDYSNEELKNTIYSIFEHEDSFMYFRNLVMEMNLLTEDDVSPDELAQEWIEKCKRVKQRDSEKISTATMVTSIVAKTPHKYEEVYNMTIFQVYALYARITAIMNYEASTLFATVTEKVKIEMWNKEINLFEREKHTISYEDFKKTYGSMFE